MDLESLRKEAHGPNYKSFTRIIRRLEKANILHGYRHPFNKKKYVYYSSKAQKELQEEKGFKTISKDSLIHDIKVTEISKKFLELRWIDQVMLEHQLLGIDCFKSLYKIIPDAMFTLANGKRSYNLAFELELTQKSKSRIKEKAKQFLISPKYDYMLFFFSQKSLMESYMRTIKEEVGSDGIGKFIFIHAEDLRIKEVELEKLKCSYKDKEFKLEELFSTLSKL
jgi:hypothetical protein